MARTVVVAAPRATIPPHSLLRAAQAPPSGETGWERGLTYAPETPGGYRSLASCTDAEYEDLREVATPVVEYLPWELLIEHPCHSTFGTVRTEADEQLRRALDATESYAIARELWQGDLARGSRDAATDGEEMPNLSLTDGPTVLGEGPVSPKVAVGLLEQAVGDALRGQQACLHVSRTAQPFLPDLFRDGNLLTTRIGNLVVADAGYPNTAPGGAAAAAGVGWVYATGPVVVRRGSVFPREEDAARIDTATNTATYRTGRIVAATFDRAAHFAVPVDLSA